MEARRVVEVDPAIRQIVPGCIVVRLREDGFDRCVDAVVVEGAGPLGGDEHEDKGLPGLLEAKGIAAGGERSVGDGRGEGLEHERRHNAFGGDDSGKRGVEVVKRDVKEVDIGFECSGDEQLTGGRKTQRCQCM